MKRIKNILAHYLRDLIWGVIVYLWSGNPYLAAFVSSIISYNTEFVEGRDWFWWGRKIEQGLRTSRDGIFLKALLYTLGKDDKNADSLWDWIGPAVLYFITGGIVDYLN